MAAGHEFSTCILCPATGAADVLRNVALFLPLGLLLGVWFRPLVALAIGVLISAGIEISQLWIPGRFPGLSDMFWNGFGAALGALAVNPLRAWLRQGAPLPAMIVAAALPVALVFFLSLLLLPVRASLPYFGQWTPEGLILEPYRGRVLTAELNGIPIPEGQFPADARPDLALAGDWAVSVTMTKGPVPVSPSTVIRLHSDIGIFYLAVNGEDVVWHERTWGQRLGFNDADPVFAGAMSRYDEGDVVIIGARRQEGRLCLLVGHEESCNHGVSPAQTWVLLAGPKLRPATPRIFADLLWMGSLFLAVGLLGGRRRTTILLTAMAATGVMLAVWTTPLASPGPADLAGLLLGVAAGVALRPVVRLLLDDARVGSWKPA